MSYPSHCTRVLGPDAVCHPLAVADRESQLGSVTNVNVLATVWCQEPSDRGDCEDREDRTVLGGLHTGGVWMDTTVVVED